MKTGFKYFVWVILAAVVLSAVLPVFLNIRDAYAFGGELAKFAMVYLGTPAFLVGIWIQSKRNKHASSDQQVPLQKSE